MISVIRKLQKDSTYFITISEVRKGEKYYLTIAPAGENWRDNIVEMVREVGRAHIIKSAKIFIPSHIVKRLNLERGRYVWVTMREVKSDIDDYTPPSHPFIYVSRSVIRTGNTVAVTIARSYMDTLLSMVEDPSNDILVMLNTSPPVITITRPRVSDNHYKLIIPQSDLQPLHEEGKRITGTRQRTLIAPLPSANQRQVIRELRSYLT